MKLLFICLLSSLAFAICQPAQSIKGRIEIYTPGRTGKDAMCLLQSTTSIITDSQNSFMLPLGGTPGMQLAVGPCSYIGGYVLYWDSTQQLLHNGFSYAVFTNSYKSDDDYRVVMYPYLRMPKGNFKTSISFTTYAPVTFTDGTTEGCLSVQDEVLLVTRTDPNDNTPCSLLRFISLKDDVEPISLRDETGTQCATYVPSAAPPASSLVMKPCKTSDKNQNLYVNRVSGQLRWMNSPSDDFYTSPLFFYWWGGPIKTYLNFDKIDANGWAFVNRMAISTDGRGYSGYCWTVHADKQIFVNQTCSTIDIANQRAAPQSVSVVIKANINNKNMCLTAKRQATTGQKRHIWGAAFEDCNAHVFSYLPQRWVFTTSDAACSAKELTHTNPTPCKGSLRWSGNPANTLLWLSAAKKLAVFSSETPEKQSWDIKMFAANKVRYYDSTAKGAAQYPGCWSVDTSRNLVYTTDASKCQDVTFVTARSISGLASSVNLVSSYDGSATYGASSKPANDDKAANVGFADYKAFAPTQYQTFYVADLGFAGTNRVTRHLNPVSLTGGTSAQMSHSIRIVSPCYLTIPFARTVAGQSLDLGITSSATTGLISVRFQLNTGYFTGRALYLFGFAHTQGCTVYVTVAGHLGVRCLWNRRDGYSCQFRLSNGFSLNDNKVHTVSLLYSATKAHPSVLYIEDKVVGECATPRDWAPQETAQDLHVFTQPGRADYHWTSGYVNAVRVYTGPFAELQKVATTIQNDATLDRLVADPPVMSKLELAEQELAEQSGSSKFLQRLGMRRPGDDADRTARQIFQYIQPYLAFLKAAKPSFTATLVPALTTTWDNCEIVTDPNPGGADPNAVKCRLNVFLNGKPYVTTPDIFTLSCSRPNCLAYILDDPKTTASSFSFTYQPKYSKQFTSENVGNPGLFRDPAFLFDGYSLGRAAFGINYEKNGAVTMLEVEDGTQVEVADQMRYRLKQSCCVAVRPMISFDDGDSF